MGFAKQVKLNLGVFVIFKGLTVKTLTIKPKQNVFLKVIMHKLRGELVDQNTIENVFVAYLKFIIKFPRKKVTFFSPPFYATF